jgi:hypothetical protein
MAGLVPAISFGECFARYSVVIAREGGRSSLTFTTQKRLDARLRGHDD